MGLPQRSYSRPKSHRHTCPGGLRMMLSQASRHRALSPRTYLQTHLTISYQRILETETSPHLSFYLVYMSTIPSVGKMGDKEWAVKGATEEENQQ